MNDQQIIDFLRFNGLGNHISKETLKTFLKAYKLANKIK